MVEQPRRKQRGIKPVLRNKVVGSRTDRRLAFFTGLKKVSKEKTALAAGMTVRLVGWLIQFCCFECRTSLLMQGGFTR
jgi:hypothetical protein